MSKYETKVSLPTRGILYDGIPPEVTIRAITTNEEKMIFGSSTPSVLSKVIAKCIVEPKDLNIEELVPSDEQAILIKLRSHTYGSNYVIQGECPHCGQIHEYQVDLDDYETIYLSEDFTEPMEMTLPDSGVTLSTKILRNKDLDSINKLAKKQAKKSIESEADILYIYRIAKCITAIDGEEVDLFKAAKFVKELTGKDSAYFFWYTDKHYDCGLDTVSFENCLSCGEEFDLDFSINREFFRPRFE